MTLSDEDRRRIEEEELSKLTLESRKRDEAEYCKQTRARLKREAKYLTEKRSELRLAENLLQSFEADIQVAEDKVKNWEAHLQVRRSWVEQLEQDPPATLESDPTLTVEHARELVELYLVHLKEARLALEQATVRLVPVRHYVHNLRADLEYRTKGMNEVGWRISQDLFQQLERATRRMKDVGYWLWQLVKLW